MSNRLQFVLTGFTQDLGFRVFLFDRVAEDWSRTAFSVRTDISLARRYGIPLQDLPLLCRGLLERHDEAAGENALTFTEDEMRTQEQARAASRSLAARKRKFPKRSASEQESGVSEQEPKVYG